MEGFTPTAIKSALFAIVYFMIPISIYTAVQLYRIKDVKDAEDKKRKTNEILWVPLAAIIVLFPAAILYAVLRPI